MATAAYGQEAEFRLREQVHFGGWDGLRGFDTCERQKNSFFYKGRNISAAALDLGSCYLENSAAVADNPHVLKIAE
jgi:hypothetical protein